MQGKAINLLSSFDEILPKINKDGLFEIGIGILCIREISPENNLAEIDFI